MKTFTFIAFFALLTVVSCKKDPIAAPKSCGKTVAEIAGNYSLTKIELANGTMFTDVTTTYLLPCQLDDKLMLNANGVANFVDEGTVCTPSGSRNGNWTLSADSKITIAGGSISVANADIVSFDCNILVLLANQTVAGFPVQIRLTIKK